MFLLVTVAEDGEQYVSVHRSRAECWDAVRVWVDPDGKYDSLRRADRSEWLDELEGEFDIRASVVPLAAVVPTRELALQLVEPLCAQHGIGAPLFGPGDVPVLDEEHGGPPLTDAELAAVAASPLWEQAVQEMSEAAGRHLPDLHRAADGSFALLAQSGFDRECYAADGTRLDGRAVS